MIWWSAFEIIINLYQGFLMIFFMKKRIRVVKNELYIDLIFLIAIATFLSLYLILDFPLPDTIVFSLPFLYVCVVSEERWYVKMFWALVLATVFIAIINFIRNLYLHIPNVTWELIMSETQLRMAFVVSCNIALLLVLFLLSRTNQKKHALSWLPQIVFLILIASQLLTVELLFSIRLETKAADMTFILSDISIMGSTIISLSLYEILSTVSEKRHQAEDEVRMLQSTQQHQEELRSMYANMLAYQHDFRHRIQTIEQLLASKSLIDCKLITDSIAELGEFGFEFVTGCTAVDAVLTAKKMKMDQNNIDFEFIPYPLQKLPIPEGDFCILLANILDNATEAVQRLPANSANRKITLSFSCSWEMFYLVCANDMLPSSIHHSGTHFLSSKKNPAVHGFGTESIRNIAERADGRCHFSIKESVFEVEVVIPFATTKESKDEKSEQLYFPANR